ncbi:TonB-dependent receptor [Dechloromonas agitata]|uniref:TonB-dependent receptor plug domain-containing protein n=1 Tax=Dechloromonas agitata TaxID=73030 RepID=UPI00237D3937|nr:TonB-dependent receptor [Dechloromonas agitata]MDE1543854.1 TonB-dependent receptor [Dechloromonas agitata]
MSRNTRPRLHWLIAAGLWLAAAPAQALDAIDMSLEDLLQVSIVSAPKFTENPDQIPSVVSIISAADIRLYGWRTLGAALRSLQGFNVTDDHTYAYGGVRGISQPGDYRPRQQILIDGQSMNDNIYASAPVDSAFPLDLGLIERIEVIRGPSAAIYGGDAMFGVINVVTRSGTSVGRVASLKLGSGADRRLRLSWGGQVGGADVLVSATSFGVHGRTLSVDDVNGDGSRRDLHRVGGEDGGQLFAKVRGSDWNFSLIHSKRERVVPTASYDTIADDHGHAETDTYTLLNLGKEWKLNAANTLHQRLYLGDYRYDGVFPYDYSADPAIADPRLMNVDLAKGSWWGIENRLVNTRWNGQRITLGIEYKSNWRQNQRNSDRGYGCVSTSGVSSDPCLNDQRSSQQVSVMAQDEIQIGSATLLTIGASYDHVSQFGSFWSPRLGVTHDAGQAGIFKLLYGTAFRVPSVYERYYTSPSFSYGNPALVPEKMRSLEVAWEKRFTQQSRLTASVYHFHIARMVTTDENGTTVNDGSKVEATGLELEYEQRWSNGSRLRTGYSIQHAADATRRFDNSPRHMVKANLGLPTGIPHLMAGLESQWISARTADYGTQKVPSYLLANLNLLYTPAGRPWEIALGIYNLFDRHYTDPVATDEILGARRWQIPQFGRSAMLRTTLHF